MTKKVIIKGGSMFLFCPFCGQETLALSAEEPNLYCCIECKSEFAMIEKGKYFILKKKLSELKHDER